MCHSSQGLLREMHASAHRPQRPHTHTRAQNYIYQYICFQIQLFNVESHEFTLESISNSNFVSHKIFLAFFLSIFINPFSENKIVPIIRIPLCMTHLLIQLGCYATGCWLPPAPFQLVPSSSMGPDPPTGPACPPSSCWSHNPFSDLSSFCHLPCLGLPSGFLTAEERKEDNTCFKIKG